MDFDRIDAGLAQIVAIADHLTQLLSDDPDITAVEREDVDRIHQIAARTRQTLAARVLG